MTPLGILFVVITGIAVVSRRGFVRLIAIAASFPIGVVATVAGQPAPTFFVIGAGALVAMVVAFVVRRSPDRTARLVDRPGAIALLLFTAWSLFVTAVAPTVFEGIPVLVARGGIDEQFLDPGTLAYTVSNFAQAGYLIISIGVVFFIARSAKATPGLLAITLGLITVISFWRLLSLSGLPYPVGFFDNSTAVRIIETTPDGEARFRGIFSEPSGLAAASLTTLVFFSLRLRFQRGWVLVGAITVMVMAAVNAASSTAGTFVAAGLIMVAIVVIAWLGGFVLNRTRLNPMVAAVALVLVGAGAFFVPLLVEFIESVVNVKVSSSSYGSRTGVDLFSYMLTLDTWGFGVGLGSNRPSSFIAMLASCTGVPGLLLFTIALARIMATAWRKPEYRPTVWALVSVLVCKAVSSPNLSEPGALLWIAIGVLAQGAWQKRDADDLGMVDPALQARTAQAYIPLPVRTRRLIPARYSAGEV